MKKITNDNIAQEVEMNKIIITPVIAPQTALVLNYNLYDIASVNTKEVIILASPAETTQRQNATNMFYIQKTSDEAELLTAVSEGKVRLTKTDETQDSEQTQDLLLINLKPAEFMSK